jgi:5-methylcytosine-specific restriction endonuclease McrA
MAKVGCEAIENINGKKYKLNVRGRHSEIQGRTPTASQQRELYERGEGVCEKCGSLFKVQKDHRHPYALGGKTETSNLRLLCFHCNQRERIKAKL